MNKKKKKKEKKNTSVPRKVGMLEHASQSKGLHGYSKHNCFCRKNFNAQCVGKFDITIFFFFFLVVKLKMTIVLETFFLMKKMGRGGNLSWT